MKIVILDAYATVPNDISWDEIAELGELTIYDRTPPELIVERIGDADAIISSKVKIGREVFEQCPNLKYIGLLSTGYDVIDVKAAKEHGVAVCNAPGYSTEAVAQMAFALLLEITNMVAMHSDEVYKGRWTQGPDWCFWLKPHIELMGLTFGVLGFGSIGQAAGRMANAFGMKVLYYSRHQKKEAENENTVYAGDYDTLFRGSDIIMVSCPLTDETRNIIRKENIDKMKGGVIIINIARGGLVNEEDIAEALKSGKVWGFGTDVASTEPIQMDNPLLTAPNCYITPHIAWVPYETRKRMIRIVTDNIKSFAEGKIVNCVNP